MSGNNGPALTVEAQMNHVLNWFIEFTPTERRQFMLIIFQCFGSPHAQNGVSVANSLSPGNTLYPSIFHCRMELFTEWSSRWNLVDRYTFLDNLRFIDDNFVDAYEAGFLPDPPSDPADQDESF